VTAERKPGIADNPIVDEALFETDDAQASLELPPHVDSLAWQSEGYWNGESGIGVGVTRVHVHPEDGISVSVHLEDADTGFDVGAMVSYDTEEAIELADAIRETALGVADR